MRGTEEYLFVQEGCIEIVVEDTSFKLKTGDSMCFDGMVRHVYKNPYQRVAKVYCMNYYGNN